MKIKKYILLFQNNILFLWKSFHSHQSFYTQFFPENGEVVEPQIQTLDVVSNLSGCITGDGVMLFSGKGTVVRHEMAPAEAVARIAASRLDHPLPPEPVYLRDADVSC